MLSSWQIAAIHAQQAQGFATQPVQPISAPMPYPYGAANPAPFSPMGGGAFGAGPGPGYNYGAGRDVKGFGNFATSVVGGVGQSAFSGLGMSGAMMGFGMGGLGGAVAGGIAGMGVGAIGQHVFGSMMEGAQSQQALERTLSQFRFQNQSASGGHGFSRQDQLAIGNMVRQLERMPDMLTSFGELNRIMDKMGQMGLMQNIKNVGDFTTKFQRTVDTLRDMAKMMGTTMEGALQAFGESRMAGFYSNESILRNTLNRQVTAGVTGMSMEQTGQLQMYGAEASHARGGSRRGGAAAFTRQAQQLGAAVQMGYMSPEAIAEMTGKEGAEGIQMAAAQLQDLSYKMIKSSVGTAMVLGLAEVDSGGQTTGAMDKNLVEQYRAGRISKEDLVSRAGAIRGRGHEAMMRFVAHRDRLTTEAANALGPIPIINELSTLLKGHGYSSEQAVSLVGQRFGASEEEMNMLQGLAPHVGDIERELQSQRQREVKQNVQNAKMSQYSWDAIKKRISTNVKAVTTDWANDAGVAIRDYFNTWMENYVDDVTGTYRTEMTQHGANLIKASLTGDKKATAYLKGLTSGGAIGSERGNNRITLGDDMHSMSNLIAGSMAGGTQGMRTAQYLEGIGSGFVDKEDAFDTSFLGYGRLATRFTSSQDQLHAAAKRMMGLSSTEKGSLGDKARGALKTQLGSDEYRNLEQMYVQATGSTAVMNAEDDPARAAAIKESLRQQYLKKYSPKVTGDEVPFWQRGAVEMDQYGQLKYESIEELEASKKASASVERLGQLGKLMPGGGGLSGALLAVGAGMGRTFGLSGERGADSLNLAASYGDVNALHRKTEEDRKTIVNRMKGEGGGYTGAQLTDMIKSDSPEAKLLLGAPGGLPGLLFNPDKARELLGRSFTPEDRAYLSNLGLSRADQDAIESDPERKKKLLAAINEGEKEKILDVIQSFVKGSDKESTRAFAEDLKARGLNLKNATDAEGRNKLELLKLTDGGRDKGVNEFLQTAHRLGEAESDDKRRGEVMSDFDSVVSSYRKLSGDKSRAGQERLKKLRASGLVPGLEGVEAAAERDESVHKRLSGYGKTRFGKDGKGVSLREALGDDVRGGEAADLFSKLGSDASLGLSYDDKTHEPLIKSKEQLEKVEAAISASGHATGLMGMKAGAGAESQAATEKEVAEALKKMSENVTQQAQLIKDLMQNKTSP